MSMTFAQAMRTADEMGLPDLRNDFVERDISKWGGEKPPCCAIGGANIAAGRVKFETIATIDGTFLTYESVGAACDRPEYKGRVCRICKRRVEGLGGGLIAHLYDDHKWSRSRIADWLEENLPDVANATQWRGVGA